MFVGENFNFRMLMRSDALWEDAHSSFERYHLDQGERYTVFVPGRQDAKMSWEALSDMPLVETDCWIHTMQQGIGSCSVLAGEGTGT